MPSASSFATAGCAPGGWGLPVNWRGNEYGDQQGLSNLGRLAALGQAIGATRVTQWIPSASDERASTRTSTSMSRASSPSRASSRSIAALAWSSSVPKRSNWYKK